MMRELIKTFPEFGELDAAAILGQTGQESAGFTQWQELSPTVKGSRGGLGGWQWTGPRRRAFEAFCKRKGYSVTSYEGNLGFLIAELKGPERASRQAVVGSSTLTNKVKAFEVAFERSGVKGYKKRIQYAQRALRNYRAQYGNDVSQPKAPKAAPVSEQYVKAVQNKLNELNYPLGPADGIMGPLTESAVRDFQADNKLPVTGELDERTFLEIMQSDKSREMVDARSKVGADTVRKHYQSAFGLFVSKITAWAGLAASGVTYLWKAMLSNIEAAKPTVNQISEYFPDLEVWHVALIIMAVCAYLAWQAEQGEAEVVQSVQKGRFI